MPKKCFLFLMILFVLFGLTACSGTKRVKKISKPFSITCEGTDNLMNGVSTTNKSVYHFGADEYITDYEISTISVYDNFDTYKIYRDSALETANSNDNSRIIYHIENDDETHTVNFSYSVSFSKEDLAQMEDQEYYKAIKVLERAEANPTSSCSFEGVEREQIQ